MYNKSLPPALTASAREARQSFFCTLCNKGYARIHDFEAHENSYDHQHKKRFQEMKAMQRASQRSSSGAGGAGGSSSASDELTGIKPISLSGGKSGGGGGGGGGFKKAGFKSAFGGGEKKVEVPGRGGAGAGDADGKVEGEKMGKEADAVVESSSEDEVEGGELYDPARPTGP